MGFTNGDYVVIAIDGKYFYGVIGSVNGAQAVMVAKNFYVPIERSTQEKSWYQFDFTIKRIVIQYNNRKLDLLRGRDWELCNYRVSDRMDKFNVGPWTLAECDICRAFPGFVNHYMPIIEGSDNEFGPKYNDAIEQSLVLGSIVAAGVSAAIIGIGAVVATDGTIAAIFAGEATMGQFEWALAAGTLAMVGVAGGVGYTWNSIDDSCNNSNFGKFFMKVLSFREPVHHICATDCAVGCVLVRGIHV
jgi:hypothetical protein